MITHSFIRKFYTAILLLLAIALGLYSTSNTTFAQSPDTPQSGKLLLILDASGSMWGQIEGENKITIAKSVLKDLTGELPEGTEVGLIAYGHRQKGDCKDIETIVEIAPLDKSELNEKIEALNPKGKTPITDSVLKAIDSVRAQEDAVTVILVSDGIETCGGDPCKAVKEAKEAGVNFIMHVVGFDVSKEDVSELECAAQAGGGLYFSADSADELSKALETAVEIPADLPTGRLSVKVTAEGKLQDAMIVLTNTQTGEELKGQRTYSKPNTNPRIISLPDGTYDLEVKPVGMKGVASRTISGMEITQGAVVEKEVDFSFGELSVKVMSNAKLMDAAVNVYEPDTESEVAKGRTYTKSNTNPIVFKLGPGVYDLQVNAIKIEGTPSQSFKALEIMSGETIEQLVDFSSGTLMVGALKGEKFIDALVHIKDPDTGEQVAQGRTYLSSKTNPRVFELSPGTYDVTVKAVKITNTPSQEFSGVEITASETVEKTAQFSSGQLKVGAKDGERFVDALVTITDSKTGERIAQGRTYVSSKTNPKVFDLAPGMYDVKVSAAKIQGKPSEEFNGIEIKSGEDVEHTAQFPSGILKVGAKVGEALIDSTVIIKDAKTGERTAQGRTGLKQKQNPIEFLIIPGTYDVTIKPNKVEAEPVEELGIEVKAGESVERIADFSQ